jgi:hypothetical protein
MNTKHILIAALLASAFAPAMASTSADSAEPALAVRFEAFEGGDADDNGGPGKQHQVMQERFVINGADAGGFDHGAFTGPLMGMHGKVVKNAPYSAEAVSEQSQTLTDGNQIVNKTSTMSYRDSAGRTRQEVRNASGAVRTITINDAAEGTTWILNPETKTATKIGPRSELAQIAAEKARLGAEKGRLAGEKARIRIEEMHKEGGAPHEEIIIKRVERNEAEAGQRIRENVRIQVSKNMMGAHQQMAGLDRLERLSPMIAGAFGDMKWSTKASTKDLGSKDIDGVKANGKLRSYEIPAGEIGNRNPIVVSTETWYSPELQVTLLSKRSDPRLGERSYRLSGLKREEPAASLFTVPSDYTVRDVLANLKKTVEEKK